MHKSFYVTVLGNIKAGFAFSRSLNGTFPWRNCSLKTYVYYNPSGNSNKYKSSLKLKVKLKKACFLQGKVSLRYISTKCKTSVCVLRKICLQYSQRLAPKTFWLLRNLKKKTMQLPIKLHFFQILEHSGPSAVR